MMWYTNLTMRLLSAVFGVVPAVYYLVVRPKGPDWCLVIAIVLSNLVVGAIAFRATRRSGRINRPTGIAIGIVAFLIGESTGLLTIWIVSPQCSAFFPVFGFLSAILATLCVQVWAQWALYGCDESRNSLKWEE